MEPNTDRRSSSPEYLARLRAAKKRFLIDAFLCAVVGALIGIGLRSLTYQHPKREHEAKWMLPQAEPIAVHHVHSTNNYWNESFYIGEPTNRPQEEVTNSPTNLTNLVTADVYTVFQLTNNFYMEFSGNTYFVKITDEEWSTLTILYPEKVRKLGMGTNFLSSFNFLSDKPVNLKRFLPQE